MFTVKLVLVVIGIAVSTASWAAERPVTVVSAIASPDGVVSMSSSASHELWTDADGGMVVSDSFIAGDSREIRIFDWDGGGFALKTDIIAGPGAEVWLQQGQAPPFRL